MGQNWVRNNWAIHDMEKKLSGQLLPVQMSPRHLESVKDGPRNLPLKFGQNRVSISWDIPDMDNANCFNLFKTLMSSKTSNILALTSFNRSIWSLQLKYLKSSIKVYEMLFHLKSSIDKFDVFNWSIWSL